VQTIGRVGGGEGVGSRGRYGKDSTRRELRGGAGAGAGRGGGGARGGFGRGAGAERGTGGGRAAASRGANPVANRNPGGNPFKSSRQPLRDPDFYDADYTDERDTTEVPGGERLQKVLAQAGVASRRACEEMIGDGRVTVDGQVVRRFGARVDPAKQIIHVDGKRIPTASDLVYFALNKPIGVVSTMDDPDGRPCLQNFVQDLAPRLFHVGRLDTETEGLLLFTNDGELAHRLTHPSYGVKKKYWAKVPGPVPRDLHRILRKGVELEDGLAKVDEFHIVQEHGQQALVEIVLHEGRKHIVRRMLEETGHRVIDLARIEFGPVKLGRLKPGTVRALTLQEVGDLYAAVGL
jgi:23S rRNA pseudouridine2605 synthase